MAEIGIGNSTFSLHGNILSCSSYTSSPGSKSSYNVKVLLDGNCVNECYAFKHHTIENNEWSISFYGDDVTKLNFWDVSVILEF